MYAFYYLNHNVSYQDALRDIIKRGGDTDTNACIVGGLLGAACGFNNLPKDIKNEFFDKDKIKKLKKDRRLIKHELIA